MTKKRHRYSNKKLSRGEPPNFLGQHLMINKKLTEEIVRRANVKKNETVLELGAGKGALTTHLKEKAGKLLAVEYDQSFVDILNRKFHLSPNIKIIHQDILDIRLPSEDFIVVSNIPYSITTPILKKLLGNPASKLQRGIIIMEKGAAKRFTSPFIKNYYVLAWRMFYDITYLKGIDRRNFAPPPKVDSAMIMIKKKKQRILEKKDYYPFLGLADYALKYPNDNATDVLRGIFTPSQLKHLRSSAKINVEMIVGSITVEQWGIIYKTMIQYVHPSSWPKAKKK